MEKRLFLILIIIILITSCASDIEYIDLESKLAETSYCYQMLDVSERSFISSNKRLTRIIRLVSDEIDFLPGFYNIDKISSRLKVSSVSIEELLFLLADSGYKVARTHICNRGLKTDASVIELENAIENMKS